MVKLLLAQRGFYSRELRPSPYEWLQALHLNGYDQAARRCVEAMQ